jgi:hypothetical protein
MLLANMKYKILLLALKTISRMQEPNVTCRLRQVIFRLQTIPPMQIARHNVVSPMSHLAKSKGPSLAPPQNQTPQGPLQILWLTSSNLQIFVI